MTDGSRVLPLLAASGLTSSEIRDFLLWAKHTNIDEGVRIVIKTRNQIKNLQAFDADLVQGSDDHRITSKAIARDVTKLIDESELTVPQAVFQISRLLQQTYPDRGDPAQSFSPKEGFRRWVSRTASRYGDSVFLSAAIAALDKKRESDWRLG